MVAMNKSHKYISICKSCSPEEVVNLIFPWGGGVALANLLLCVPVQKARGHLH